jgi:hypothetical protein
VHRDPALPWPIDSRPLETLERLKKVYAFPQPGAKIIPVTISEFGGYALLGPIHFGLNVPAVYLDLSRN